MKFDNGNKVKVHTTLNKFNRLCHFTMPTVHGTKTKKNYWPVQSKKRNKKPQKVL